MPLRDVVTTSALLVVLSMPAPAAARNKWFGWLEDLSGPGPFRGNTLRLDLVCEGALEERDLQAYASAVVAVPRDDPRREERLAALRATLERSGWCRPDRANVRYSIGVEKGWWDAEPNARYDGDVHLDTYFVVLYVPIQRVVTLKAPPLNTKWTRAFEVGAGLGAYKLYGSAVRDHDYWRMAVPLRVRLFPSNLFSTPDDRAELSKWQRVLGAIELYAGYDYIPGALPGAAFRLTDAVSPTQLSRREFVFVRGITINILAWWPNSALTR